MLKRRTKIVTTLGPATDSREKIEALMDAGANVFRFNCSHGDWETKLRWVDWLRSTWTEGPPPAILADLQGPKIRLGHLPDDEMLLETGSKVLITQSEGTHLSIPDEQIYGELASGDRVLIGDGHVELRILERGTDTVSAVVSSGGTVRTKQGVTIVGRSFPVDSITAKDRMDIEQAAAAGVDFLALSYVRTAEEMVALRELVAPLRPSIRLCAKIETREAVRNIDSIIEKSDLIMVARGDLGLQVDIEDVPIHQKHIIRRCLVHGKPVITATQMLESMIDSPRPTRAEATDIANAVLDGTDALMLSGETAAGNYPVEAARMMARIAERAESQFNHLAHFAAADVFGKDVEIRHTEAVAQAAVQLAISLRAKAIVCTSTSGKTPQLVAKFRPPCPILCATWSAEVQRQLAATWGVETILQPCEGSSHEVIHNALAMFRQSRRLKAHDLVIVTAGVPIGIAGKTNLVQVELVPE